MTRHAKCWSESRGASRAIAGFLLFLWGTSLAVAEDRVSYIPEGSTRPIVLVGEVLDSNGRRVVVKSPSGPPQSIPAEAVQGIETVYQESHLRGVEQFRRGELQEARASLLEAIRLEPREWVDREILVWLVKAAQREQNLSGALEFFREIVRTDPLTRHWGIAPLIWGPQSVSEAVRVDARRWLVGYNPSDQLLGASLLLADPIYSEKAQERLAGLARDSNASISSLSKAQLWRVSLSQRNVSDLALESWRDQIELMPRHLRSGPQMLVANGYESRGASRRAAAEWLWIPLVYADNETLSTRALVEAGDALKRTGLTAEAEVLYRELQERYPWSREAAQAASR